MFFFIYFFCFRSVCVYFRGSFLIFLASRERNGIAPRIFFPPVCDLLICRWGKLTIQTVYLCANSTWVSYKRGQMRNHRCRERIRLIHIRQEYLSAFDCVRDNIFSLEMRCVCWYIDETSAKLDVNKLTDPYVFFKLLFRLIVIKWKLFKWFPFLSILICKENLS